MAILKVSSEVRLNPSFQEKVQRDLEKIEEMSPRNTLLRVVLKRSEAGLFETEMEAIGFTKNLFIKARATNAFAAFKKCRDLLIKQIHKQVARTRDQHAKHMRASKKEFFFPNELVPVPES